MADTTAPSTGSPVLRVATDTLKLVVGMAASPGGLELAANLIGIGNPALAILAQFGIRLLGPLLATWTAPDISDADVETSLATRGQKVAAYDPMAAVNT